MSVEDLDDILSSWPKANLRTCDTLTHIPISSPKGGRTSIERILEHGAFLNRPMTQDGQTTPESAAMVKLAIGKNLASMVTNSLIILLCKTFLQSYNLRCRHSVCNSMADLV